MIDIRNQDLRGMCDLIHELEQAIGGGVDITVSYRDGKMYFAMYWPDGSGYLHVVSRIELEAANYSIAAVIFDKVKAERFRYLWVVDKPA